MLFETVIILSELSSIISTLQELEQMHQLNLELLEQLDVVCKWIVETNMPFPNTEKLASLLAKSQALLKEIYSRSSITVVEYKHLTDEKKHLFKADGEVTECLNQTETRRRYITFHC